MNGRFARGCIFAAVVRKWVLARLTFRTATAQGLTINDGADWKNWEMIGCVFLRKIFEFLFGFYHYCSRSPPFLSNTGTPMRVLGIALLIYLKEAYLTIDFKAGTASLEVGLEIT